MTVISLKINHIYYLLIFILFICCNADILLFANCELLINIVLVGLFFLIFNVSFTYNFKDIFFRYPILLKKDLLLSQSILLYYYRRFVIYIYRCRINFAEFLHRIYVNMLSFILKSMEYIYMLWLLSVYSYVEVRLLMTTLVFIPVLKEVITRLSVLSFCFSITHMMHSIATRYICI